MLAEARASLDQAKRREIYNEMQIMVSEEAGTIIPAYISNVDAVTEKLKGLEPNPLGGMINAARVLREGRLDPAKQAEYLELVLDGLERVRTSA